MIHRGHTHVCALCFVISTCSGCANSLPKYSWSGADRAIETMSHRDRSMETFSATCQLMLGSDDGDVELSGVLVARPPSHLRLRATKLMQTVFDMTLIPEGLFVFSQTRDGNGPSTRESLTRDGLIEAISFLPGFSRKTDWRIDGSADEHHFSRSRRLRDGETTIICLVEKSTLTTTRCDYLNNAGIAQQSITFDDYRLFGEVVWPMHIVGVGRGGSFEIFFHDVEINPDLPDRAFIPSRRAVKQP